MKLFKNGLRTFRYEIIMNKNKEDIKLKCKSYRRNKQTDIVLGSASKYYLYEHK